MTKVISVRRLDHCKVPAFCIHALCLARSIRELDDELDVIRSAPFEYLGRDVSLASINKKDAWLFGCKLLSVQALQIVDHCLHVPYEQFAVERALGVRSYERWDMFCHCTFRFCEGDFKQIPIIISQILSFQVCVLPEIKNKPREECFLF